MKNLQKRGLLFVTVCLFVLIKINAQPLVINERRWSVGAEAGNIRYGEAGAISDMLRGEANLPRGMNVSLTGNYSWIDSTRNATQIGIGLRYESMFAHQVIVQLNHIQSEFYREHSQRAYYLQINFTRKVAFKKDYMYWLFGMNANIKLSAIHSGQYIRNGLAGSSYVNELYTNKTDPNRRSYFLAPFTGFGVHISDKLAIEEQFFAGTSPADNFKFCFGFRAGLFYSFGKPNKKVNLIYTQ
ncbi:MAG: hypothetical protein MUC87_16940 [Bacteroidia bacterium]|jgi:hypothetical protein|nr:hypothetical protein [Bacteroidia bacterium]